MNSYGSVVDALLYKIVSDVYLCIMHGFYYFHKMFSNFTNGHINCMHKYQRN